MRLRPLVLAAWALSACASNPAGPTTGEFSHLITSGDAAPAVRSVRCGFVTEEGSEWVCRYQERASTGVWVDLAAVVTRDGDRWALIDAVCTADQALADRGRCRR